MKFQYDSPPNSIFKRVGMPYRRKNAAVAALDCFVKSFQAATQAKIVPVAPLAPCPPVISWGTPEW